jgi:hypothetical protein
MKIVINDRRKIYAVQEEFQAMFPYLKLEFFAKAPKEGGTPSTKIIKSDSKALGECRTNHTSGVLTITPQMTVADLEEHLEDKYGLVVQVFRQSGSAWLETTVTDKWSLDKQNKEGEELSKHFKV